MSAVLESVSPVAAARAALEAVQAELGALDARIRGYEQEAETRDAEQRAWRMADTQAVIRNQSRPKQLKLKPSDAAVALPILRARRKEIIEREAECQGHMRRALVDEVERRFLRAQDSFAEAVRQLTDAWAELVGTHALIEQAGVTRHPLPPALMNDLNIPAFAKLRPLVENHAMHFVASHSVALGVAQRAMRTARAEIERELGARLPW